MDIQETGCCAIDEIHGLSEHRDPKSAMIALCTLLDENSGYSDYDYGYYGGYRGPARDNNEGLTGFQPQSFYTFTGVIKQPGSKPMYGPRFAGFIKRNKLGVVTASKAKYNRLNHPDHLVRHWTWAVNVKNLKKWWSKNRAD